MLTKITPARIEVIKEMIKNKFVDCIGMISDINISEHCEYIDRKRQLGSGTYGVVKLAKNPQNNELVVLKICKNKERNELRISTVRELCILSQFNHQNILKLLNICVSEHLTNGELRPKFTLVLELCRCDLGDVIFDGIGIRECHRKNIIQQILRGVEHMHSHSILHRDLKPTNVLIGRDGFVKIADFGLSRLKNEEDLYTPSIGTKGYMPPEVMLKLGKYNEGFDMFSVGGFDPVKIAHSMVRVLGRVDNDSLPGSEQSSSYGELFFRARCETPLLRYLMKKNYATEAAMDLAEKLLSINPANRPSANEALQHPYFVNRPKPSRNLLSLIPATWGNYR